VAGALRPAKPLSEVLAHGRLHEIAAAIEDLNAVEFERLPPGQRTLILVKCDDIVSSGDEDLKSASSRFLELLLARGLLLPKEDYRGIVGPAIRWAFEQVHHGKQGSTTLQIALERAATEARDPAHVVLVEELLAFLKAITVEDKPNWYLQILRNLLGALMANQACQTNVDELAAVMKKVNRTQRSRTD